MGSDVETSPVAIGITAVTFSIASIVALITLHLHRVKLQSRPVAQKFYVRILLLPPLYALCALIIANAPVTIHWVEFALSLIETFCVFYYLKLLIALLGGLDGAAKVLDDKKITLCGCNFYGNNGRTRVRRLELAVIQFVVIKNLTMLGNAIAHTRHANTLISTPVLQVVNLVSLIFAMLTIIRAYHAMGSELQAFSPSGKFFAIKLIVLLETLEGVIVGGLAANGRISESTEVNVTASFLSIVAALFSVVFFFYFGVKDFQDEQNPLPLYQLGFLSLFNVTDLKTAPKKNEAGFHEGRPAAIVIAATEPQYGSVNREL